MLNHAEAQNVDAKKIAYTKLLKKVRMLSFIIRL